MDDHADSPDRATRETEGQPIHRVGVCVDRSSLADRFVPYAASLARAFGAKLTVLHVIEPLHEDANAELTDPIDWEFKRAEAQKHLAAVSSQHGAGDFAVATEILEGSPAEEIRDWVSAHEIDLTVLASHGASADNAATRATGSRWQPAVAACTDALFAGHWNGDTLRTPLIFPILLSRLLAR